MPRKGENIYKRKDGRWEGRYIKAYNPDGKPRYGYLYAATYREVKARLTAAKAALPEPETSGPWLESASFRNLALEWLTCQKPLIKESSYNKYRNLIHSYIIPELGTVLISEFSDSDLQRFSTMLLAHGGKKKQGLSPKTTADTVSVLQRIIRYAIEQGYPTRSTGRRIIIRRNEKQLRVLTAGEQNRLCQYLLDHLESRNLGILLCLFTGIRIGELCALTWNDISLEENTIHIHQTMQRVQISQPASRKTKILISSPKSSCSIRTIPLTAEMAALLTDNRQQGYLLTGLKNRYLEPRTMQNHFRKAVQESGIAPANFHALRHTFATRCIELGFDVKTLSEILGHSNVNITMNRYVHPSMDLKRQSMQRLSQLFTVK